MAARLATDLDAGAASVAGDLRFITEGGETRWVRILGTRFRCEGQDNYLLNVTDISERKRLEVELTEKALHDPLTGLANRRLLAERLVESLSRTAHEGSTMAVLYLDLDRFKRINDLAGHSTGDRALVTIAERLRHILRPTDTLARMGGDEFVIVCDGLGSVDDGLEVGRRAKEAIAEPVQVDGQVFDVTVSIGVTSVEGREAAQWSADRLLTAADDAMYASKVVRSPLSDHRLRRRPDAEESHRLSTLLASGCTRSRGVSLRASAMLPVAVGECQLGPRSLSPPSVYPPVPPCPPTNIAAPPATRPSTSSSPSATTR